MLDTAFLIEIVKAIGFPAVIFVIWFLYHKSQVEQQKQSSKDNVKMFTKIIDEQAQREERNYKLLKEMLETHQYHGALLSVIKEKIDTNQWCPYIKEIQSDKYRKQAD